MKDERDNRVPLDALRAWWHRRFGHPAKGLEPYAYMWLLCTGCGDIGPLPLDATETAEKRLMINKASKSWPGGTRRKPLKRRLSA